MSSSFNYTTTDVVDFEAMNITEMFPEGSSSFSFDMSSNYNHSYSDSISGIPLSQQQLWEDGQLSLQPMSNDTSRVFNNLSPLSSLNNSINLGHHHSRQTTGGSNLTVPSSSHLHFGGRQHPLSQQQSYQSSESGSGSGGENNYNDYDEGDESSLQQGWVDDTRDQNGIMLLNDKAHMDEQHLLFLQDIGGASLSRGENSLSLFAHLEDDGELSCDLFNEKLDIMDTSGGLNNTSLDRSPLRIDTSNNNRRSGLENEIFDQEFMAALKTPLFPQPPPPLESAKKKNFFEGLHTIVDPPAPKSETDTKITDSHQQDQQQEQRSENDEERPRHGSEAYQTALKSFLDSLKVADPIKTPHKFAPQPLPILWNEPKIRSKIFPDFKLADYKDKAKTLPPIRLSGTGAGGGGSAAAHLFANHQNVHQKFGSLSSSPTNTHSNPVSAQSSPMSSISTSPPTGIDPRLLATSDEPPTPTTPTANSLGYLQRRAQQQEQQPSSSSSMRPELTLTADRFKRLSTIQNSHLAFDPTKEPESSRDNNNTVERRQSILREPRVRTETTASGTVVVRRMSSPIEPEDNLQGTVGPSGGGVSGLRGPVVRKRRSLHQDMFFQDQANEAGFQEMQQQEPHGEGSTGIPRRVSRPPSMNILPESLTAMNNPPSRPESTTQERTRRLSEEEGGEQSRIPGALSLGRTVGSRFARSGSGSTLNSPLTPTTPTASNIYGTLSGRARQGSRPPAFGGSASPQLEPQNPPSSTGSTGSRPPPPVTLSRNGSRSSPPLALQGLGSVHTNLSSPNSADYDDDYRSEIPSHRVQATPIRTQFQFQNRQESSPNKAPSSASSSTADWDVVDRHDENVDDYEVETPRAITRAPMTLNRRSSQELQKEQRQQQRLRIQQQALEDRYAYNNDHEIEGGAGSGDADDYMNSFPQPPPRDQLTGRRTLPLSGTNPTFALQQPPSSHISRYQQDPAHNRRLSKDGSSGSLSLASRTSPPLPLVQSTVMPRRPLSSITNSAAPPSRRLSNAANVGVSSTYDLSPGSAGLPPPMAGGRSSIHARSTSSGAIGGPVSTGLYSPTSAGSRYSSLGRSSTLPISNVDDMTPPTRRTLSNAATAGVSPPTRRVSGVVSATIPSVGSGVGSGYGGPSGISAGTTGRSGMISSTGSLRRSSGIPSAYSSGSLISSSSNSNNLGGSNIGMPASSSGYSRRSNSASSESEYARVIVPPSSRNSSMLPSSTFAARGGPNGMSMSQDFGYADNNNSNRYSTLSNARDTIRRGNDLLDYSSGTGGDYEPVQPYRHSTIGTSGMSYGGNGGPGAGSAYTYNPVAPTRKSSLNAIVNGNLGGGSGSMIGGSVGRNAGTRAGLGIRSGHVVGGSHGSLMAEDYNNNFQYNPNQFSRTAVGGASGSALPSLQRSSTTTNAMRSTPSGGVGGGAAGNRASQMYQPTQYRQQQQQQPLQSPTQLQQPRYSYQSASQRY
ncbi:hypothetical protein BGZ83_011175 [Gryganskiella cystojenkinii]|nr:hypothetical protein BGZ83_011175 [Gryganskiella cystojenkinii]